MNLEFSGEIWYWKGPAPWYFITVPVDESRDIETTSKLVSYGWGVIPVAVRIAATGWKTALFPEDGKYLVHVRADVRRAERHEVGDTVTVRLVINV